MKPKLLRATLLVAGARFAVAGVFMFVPESWMRGMAAWFVEPEMLAAP